MILSYRQVHGGVRIAASYSYNKSVCHLPCDKPTAKVILDYLDGELQMSIRNLLPDLEEKWHILLEEGIPPIHQNTFKYWQ